MKMSYALKNGKLVHISQVENGLGCGCICPACNAPLIARQGSERSWHFAHASAEECEYGCETALHIAAKQIIEKAKWFTVPRTVYQGIEIAKAKRFRPTEVTLECVIGDIVPDVVVFRNDRKLLVEIYVTHKVDAEKRKKIKEKGYSVVEVDLSKEDRSLSPDELERIVLGDDERKQWINNTELEFMEKIGPAGVNWIRNAGQFGYTNSSADLIKLLKKDPDLLEEIRRGDPSGCLLSLRDEISVTVGVAGYSPKSWVPRICPRLIYENTEIKSGCRNCEYYVPVRHDRTAGCKFKMEKLKTLICGKDSGSFLICGRKKNGEVLEILYYSEGVQRKTYRCYTGEAASIEDIYTRFAETKHTVVLMNTETKDEYEAGYELRRQSLEQDVYCVSPLYALGGRQIVKDPKDECWTVVAVVKKTM